MTTEPSRRGRRPAGSDTRGDILEAARAEFGRLGYEATTMRGVARAAGVDARLVHHYFDGKEEMFVAAFDFPVRPQQLVQAILADGPEGVGERVVRVFLGVWHGPGGAERLRALLSAALVSDAGARMLREFVTRELLYRVAAGLDVPDPELRATLAAAQLIGIGVVGIVLGVEPLASADVEALVALAGPTLQRYLAG